MLGHPQMSDIRSLSPISMGTLGICSLEVSPMSVDSSPRQDTSNIATTDAAVKILVQPVDKFRFRYKSEMMGTHGSLLGEKDETSQRKGVPTVQLINYPGIAVIRCSLVTSEEENRMPHAHHLVKREDKEESNDFHEIEVSVENGHIAAFHGMGIIHTAKKNIKEELVRKKKIEALEKLRQNNVNGKNLSVTQVTKINQESDEAAKNMNLNSVALCFQAFYRDDNNILQILTDPVYSHSINNLKSALTGELKICRIDKHCSSCEGSEEVFILVEKVGKKNIRIKFYELDEYDNEIWCDYGKFSELDVHHQYAIVFRTPAYRDTSITSSKTVYIKLERPSDGECSNSIKFTYKASERISNKKRPRASTSCSESVEFQPYQVTNENINLNNQFSTELAKLLNEGDKLPSAELILAMEEIDFDVYSSLMDVSGKNESDGPGEKHCLLDAVTAYGDTCLRDALRYNQPDIIKTIVMILGLHPEFKSIIDVENTSRKTSLHYAVLQNLPGVVKLLPMLGANPNICDKDNTTPLHVALTLTEGAACVDVLLSDILNLGTPDRAGWVPLHLAEKAGSLSSVKSLIKAGADVNITDGSYGHSALHIAVKEGHEDIVEYLLKETKIKVNKENFGGNTALHSAVIISESSSKEICELPIEHGTDPTVSNRESTVYILELPQGKTQTNDNERNIDVEGEIIGKIAVCDNFSIVDMKQLADILDQTGGWKKLAEHMGHRILVSVLRESTTCPSITLLSHINEVGKKLVDKLDEPEDREAVA